MDPFMGEVRMMGFNFAPKGWAQCNGQTLAVAQNQALFSILGNLFGGNGVSNFQLPDFRGRVPVHFGKTFPVAGWIYGEETHTLVTNEIPAHNHSVSGSGTAGNSQYIQVVFPNPSKNAPASVAGIYGPAAASPTTLAPSSVAVAGGSTGHENRHPYSVVNFCIALQGIYPSKN